jgi:glycerol kinase
MERVAERPLEELRADGGATANAWLMQFQADVLGVPIAVAEIAETTALGAALLAGVGVGAWTQSDVASRGGERARYEPRMGDDERYVLIDDWRRAVARARGWARG